jgi:hypothetical protein
MHVFKPRAALGLLLTVVGAAACSAGERPGGNLGAVGGSGVGGGGAAGGASAGVGGVGTAGMAPTVCTPAVVTAPLRRLTRFEYNNTVRDLAKVSDAPAENFPPEDAGSGFGTDAKTQSVSEVLAAKYITTARKMAASLTLPEHIAELSPCANAPETATEAACARSVLDAFVPLAYRRPLQAGEAEDLVQLFQTVRSAGQSFPSSLAAALEAVLQAPEFLYRPELGVAVEGRADVMRPTGYEMATRLSYLFLGSMPDPALRLAAANGDLGTAEGVKAQAARLLGENGAHHVVRFFFDNLLPIASLGSLIREEHPAFTQDIGRLMREETHAFLENEVFNGGTWPNALSAPYTYLNQDLAAFYGIAGVTGPDFRKVPLDGVQRAGLLTQGGIAAGPIHSNDTNPVVRGAFVLRKLMCISIGSPPDSLGPIVKPDPALGGTARDRFRAHSDKDACRGCHAVLDPIGFALENFNAIGQWQDHENNLPINVMVDSPQLGAFNGAVEMGKKLAASPETQACFATNWANFAYARGSDEQDACTMTKLQEQFRATDYNIKDLLVELTQTDTFLYLPAVRQ